jgi:hypothetical protein
MNGKPLLISVAALAGALALPGSASAQTVIVESYGSPYAVPAYAAPGYTYVAPAPAYVAPVPTYVAPVPSVTYLTPAPALTFVAPVAPAAPAYVAPAYPTPGYAYAGPAYVPPAPVPAPAYADVGYGEDVGYAADIGYASTRACWRDSFGFRHCRWR